VPAVATMDPMTGPVLVSENFAGVVTPGTEASTSYVPVELLAVKMGEVATPEALVIATAVLAPPANVPLAPPDGAVKVTVTPPNTLFPLSRTVAISGDANAAPRAADCGVPLVAMIEAGAPGVFVIEKTASGVTPETEALTEYVPTVLFAVNSADVATPELFVTAVFTPALKMPEAPVAGAVNVTVIPGSGAPNVSFTRTLSGNVNAV
jgi:hypothetical protein